LAELGTNKIGGFKNMQPKEKTRKRKHLVSNFMIVDCIRGRAQHLYASVCRDGAAQAVTAMAQVSQNSEK